MSRWVYSKGRYLRAAAAVVSVNDRGYQFGDGVYEAIGIVGGALVHEVAHFDRLERSLAAVRIAAPAPRRVMTMIARDLVARNGVKVGMLYLQITRGVAPRAHPFPTPPVRPTLTLTARALALPALQTPQRGLAVRTMPDQRWARCDIKSIGLLPNCLARQEASETGAQEAWLVDQQGRVTEGAASNAFILSRDGVLITRPAGPEILSGVARDVALTLAAEEGVPVAQRPFTVAEALTAAEAYVTSTTLFIAPVVRIDGHPIGGGVPGPIGARLLARYRARVAAAAAVAGV